MTYVEFMKRFHLSDSNQVMVVGLISASWAQKRWILLCRHDVYVEFMKNIHLADSNEVIPVRLILASLAQKHVIPTF